MKVYFSLFIVISFSSRYNANAEVTLKLAEIAYQHGGPLSCLQTKITALISADLLVKVPNNNFIFYFNLHRLLFLLKYS